MVKAGALGDAHVKLWDRTGSNPGFEKVHIGRCVDFNHVRNSIWRRHLPIFLGVRMAEWLRPGLWEMLMLSRGIEPGQVLTCKKAHRVGLVLKLRPLVTVAGVSQN